MAGSASRHLGGCSVAQGLMGARVVGEREVAVPSAISLRHRLIALGRDLLVLDRPPPAFHKDLVMRAAPPIPADPDSRWSPLARAGGTGKRPPDRC